MNNTPPAPSLVLMPSEDLKAIQSKLDNLIEINAEQTRLKDYISKEAVCSHFDWGEATWYRLRKDNLIKVYRIGKKQYVKQSELDATLKSGSI